MDNYVLKIALWAFIVFIAVTGKAQMNDGSIGAPSALPALLFD